MEGERTRRVDLDRPIPVILFYTTAALMPHDGTIRFWGDICGHDAKLDRTLPGPAIALRVPDIDTLNRCRYDVDHARGIMG